MSLLTNLIAWWTLNESSGNRADSTGNGYTMVPTGTVTGASGFGNVGNVTTFGGSGCYLSAPQQLVTAAPFSVAGWVYHSGGATYCFIQGTSSYSPLISLSPGGYIKVLVNGVVANTNTSVGLTTWHHVAVTYDGTTLLVYLDGTQIYSAASTASFTGGGTYLNGPGGSSYGSMVAWGVWGRVLSATEVSALYNGGNGIQYPFLSTGRAQVIVTASGYNPIVAAYGVAQILTSASGTNPAVCGSGSARVSVTAGGTNPIVRTCGIAATTGMALAQARTVDNGLIWAADGHNGYVWSIDRFGNFTPYGVGLITSAAATCPASDGTVWVGDSVGHLFNITPRSGRITSYYYDSFEMDTICIGPDGNPWFTTKGGCILGLVNGVFQLIINVVGTTSICLGRDGNLWSIGLSSYYYVTQVPSGSYSSTNMGDPLYACCADHAGNIWFLGSINGVFYLIKLQNGVLVTAYDIAPGSYVAVDSICCDPNGNVVTVLGDSIFRVSPSGSLTSTTLSVPGGGTISSFCIDNEGNVWIAINVSSPSYVAYLLKVPQLGEVATYSLANAQLMGLTAGFQWPLRKVKAGLCGLAGLSGFGGLVVPR